ncbi:hypothetical protein [Leisingera sp. M523]|uniref:phage terminase large subunit family protein n=1 Tax=Leisingera sp. M523 TaxID=2867013 RepID=UPI0021A444C7|nr:hypothetical protein [Leisingera sp. M523]UWQ30251.1 hypothetical protein K3557_06860 [Leisingera sp. M523]
MDAKTKRELLSATQPYLRDARSKGTPSVGEGAIYPIPWDEVSCDPFPIPNFWRRAYGLDVGWNKTAAIWLAEDPNTGGIYAYSEYYRGQQVPTMHATAIKARGDWIPGAIDPASRGRSQDEGKKLLSQYRGAGLLVKPANNAVEFGIQTVWEMLETGRLKFFSTLHNTANEYRLYRREKRTTDLTEKVEVVKKKDHAMDALRYGIVEFSKIATVRPAGEEFTGSGFTPVDKRAGY